MKILKRNQIIISVLALMLITVGYMSYTSNITGAIETGALMDAEKVAGIGDAKLVNSSNVVESNNVGDGSKNNNETIETAESATSDNMEDIDNSTSNNTSASSISTDNKANTTTTTANSYSNDYFTTSRLERDKMYSQMIETYKNIAENNSISAEQKNISTQEITNINNKKNSIMIAENLIKNLGFEDVVIFVNDYSTSVIIKAEKLSEADIAQIQNIVCREIGVEAEVIHISLK